MFETLECQYLNKLVECEVGYLPSPEAFHTLKVQRLGRDKVKPIAQVGRQLPLPISTLVGNFTIQSCKFIDSTPPIARTFDFTTQGLVEFSELVQGLFQELRRLYLLTCVECEKSVFHAEVCAYTFTRSRQHFFRGIIGYNIKPICANTVAKDLKIPDVSFPFTVFMESEPTFVELQTLRGRIPGLKRQANTSVFKFVARLELRRTITSLAFELRFPCSFHVEKAFPSNVQSDNHSVKGIAGNPCPVLLSPLEQLRQVWLQAITTGIFAIDAIVAIFQGKKVVVDIGKVIQQIAQTFIFRMCAYLIFVRSQRFYQLSVFNP